jgi:prophage tail gpP-like protein
VTDDLTLICGQPGQERKLSGWTAVRVTRGIERLPADFDIAMTERFPGEVSAVSVNSGDPCRVLLGSDLVMTGYIDHYVPSIDARAHTIRVSGRGKCADLVDCSAEWFSNQISASSILVIARLLAKPYGITVSALTDVGKPVPQINFLWGETAYSIIDRVARYRAMLAYDAADGNLVLSRAGSASHASGFEQGKNVQRAYIDYAMDQRYSDYVVRSLAISTNSDVQGPSDVKEHLIDPAVKRHRLIDIVAEAGDTADFDIAKQRGLWELARRAGRTFNLHLTTDSWRDGAGKLWTPNQLVSLDLPALKVPKGAKWLISEVTFRRDAAGTTAELAIMPSDAFQPEPFQLLVGTNTDVQ